MPKFLYDSLLCTIFIIYLYLYKSKENSSRKKMKNAENSSLLVLKNLHRDDINTQMESRVNLQQFESFNLIVYLCTIFIIYLYLYKSKENSSRKKKKTEKRRKSIVTRT